MNRQTVFGGLIATVFAVLLGFVGFSGSNSFYDEPNYATTFTLPANPSPEVPVLITQKVECEEYYNDFVLTDEATVVLQPPGDPTTFNANHPLAARYHNFGTPLDPKLNPLVDSAKVKVDVRIIVSETWHRLCHDPMLAKATVAAAFPDWDGLHGAFNWADALALLDTLEWGSAEMKFHKEPPTDWTMMAYSADDGSEPTVRITRAKHAGWYLYVDDESGENALIARSACGGQPSLRMRAHEAHAALRTVYEIVR